MNNHLSSKIMEILLVEDNPGDIRLAREAFKESKVKTRLHIANDGIEALDFLLKKGKYIDVPKPDIILLDLNLPQKDGREVLSELKIDDALKRIPVIILTTSNSEEDIFKCYNLHANCYITKPMDFENYFKIISIIEQFWFSIVQLPNE
jgi:two-component system, chemotaxis family, response regulator Rcp1